MFEDGARDRGVAILQRGLAYIGFGVAVSGIYDEQTIKVVQAVQRRFRQDCVDGVVDIQTMDIVKWWAESVSGTV